MNDMINSSLLMNEISNIQNDLNTLNSMCDELEIMIKDTILVDNDVPEKESLVELRNITNNIIRQISEEVVPTISNKL